MSAQNKTPPSVRKVLEWNVENDLYSDFKEEKVIRRMKKVLKKQLKNRIKKLTKKKAEEIEGMTVLLTQAQIPVMMN